MSAQPLIYLAGTIHALSFDAANDWRTTATVLLAPEFGVLNPLRGKLHSTAFAGGSEQFTDDEIVTRDLMDIARSRAVLRHVASPSEGSAMETFFAAHNHGIPVVTWGPGQGDRAKLSIWLRKFTVKNYETLEEAVAYLKRHWTYPGDGTAAPAPKAVQTWDNHEFRCVA